MILDIKTYPQKILRQKAKEVGQIDAGTKKLIDDMVETLYAKGGAGLAANQVGEAKRIIVLDGGEGLKVLVNPKIVSRKGRIVLAEGCLSLPGIELEVARPSKIEVEFLDSRGQKQKIKAEQLLARIICHEVDHLEGKTILDHLSFLTRLKVKRKLKKANF